VTRNRNHQRQIRLDQLLTRPLLASNDVVRQLQFLGRGQATKATYVMQVALKQIFHVSSLPNQRCMGTQWAAGKVKKGLGLAHFFSILCFG
jgi:hypothetical protein